MMNVDEGESFHKNLRVVAHTHIGFVRDADPLLSGYLFHPAKWRICSVSRAYDAEPMTVIGVKLSGELWRGSAESGLTAFSVNCHCTRCYKEAAASMAFNPFR